MTRSRAILCTLGLLAILMAILTERASSQIENRTAFYIRAGSSLPATCSVGRGDVFFKTSATIGIYYCSATDTWTLQGTGAGGPPTGAAGGQLKDTYPNPNLSAPTTSGRILYASGAGTMGESSTVTTSTVVLGAATISSADGLPRVSAAGTLGPSKCTLTLSPVVLTCYDDTAASGRFTYILRAGAGQAGNNLLEFRSAANGLMSYFDATGASYANFYTVNLNVSLVDDLNLCSTCQVRFSDNAYHSGTKDVAVGRTAAGILEINTGTAGTYNTSVNVGGATIYNNTPTTGSTSLTVRAGAGQSTTDLQQWKNAAGATLAYVDSIGGIATPYTVLTSGESKWATGTEGTCDAANRGRLVMVQGGAGVADTFRICRKDAGDAYAFVTLM